MLYGFYQTCFTTNDYTVLILIFLENALRQMEINGKTTRYRVLILIFLENALRLGLLPEQLNVTEV